MVATEAETAHPGPPRALWACLLFVLWLVWVLALAYMGRAEWGRARALPVQERDFAPAAQGHPAARE